MEIKDILKLVDGQILTNHSHLNREVKGGCSADLMSDVLTSFQPEAVLLTGLCNPQVIRTAQMADLKAIIFVRGKQPPPETINLADQEDIPLIISPLGMYEISGRLFQAGLPSFEKPACD
jgi:predicted transcriptional regulator